VASLSPLACRLPRLTHYPLCLELDIASCGATEAEALESLQGLVELYLDDCLSQGEYPIPLRPVPCEALQELGQTG